MFVAALALGIPTGLAQNYIKKAGTLTELETINQIDKQKPSKYYTLKKCYIDKTNVGIYPLLYVSKDQLYFHMQIFYALPILDNVADTAKSSRPAWIGIKYADWISCAHNFPQRRRMYYAFARKSQTDFESKDFKTFEYLERVGSTDDTLGFKEAINKRSAAFSNKIPVFFAMDQPFESRTGNTLSCFLIAYGIGVGIWFIMLLFPKFAGSFPHAEFYILKHPEPDVLEAIESFKIDNPQHFQPKYLDLNDGRNINDQFDCHHLYFFYAEDCQIVYAWTRPIDNTSTEIALVAINEGLIPGNWKDINKDFIGQDNLCHKEKFIDTILNKVKTRIDYNESLLNNTA